VEVEAQDAVVNKLERVVVSMEIMVAGAAVLKPQVAAEMPQALSAKEETKMAMAAAAAAGIMEVVRLSMTMEAEEDRPILGVFWEEIPSLEMLQCLTLTEET
jgi:hypothetical protein